MEYERKSRRSGDKKIRFEMRMSNDDVEKLNYICRKTGKNRSDILRDALDIRYHMAKLKN